ncbi:EexN family lipoprotein [Sinorhizobium fredii]|uniref:EexN family lipoprotein n=1 Tax=Rhizobium fredii TaxID=380 RepID=UPI00339B456C
MRTSAICILLLSVAGCSSESERIYTVEELVADESLLAGIIGRCRNNPGELSSTANCRNAEAADFKARLGRIGKALGG